MSEPVYPLEIAFQLTEMGSRMRGERHRRDHPDATEAEIQAVVESWMSQRPGAPLGDCDGISITIPRSS